MQKIVREVSGYELHDDAKAPGWHHSKTGWRSDAALEGTSFARQLKSRST